MPAPSLFRRLIGPAFDRLPPPLRALHDAVGTRSYEGSCRVVRGASLLARGCGVLTGLPPACDDAPIVVSIEPRDAGEAWTRRIGVHAMRSTLRERSGLLEERLGAATFLYRLHAEEAAIRWELLRVRGAGLPLPPGWFREVTARESIRDGRYAFEVRASLPAAGLLVHYAGTLDGVA